MDSVNDSKIDGREGFPFKEDKTVRIVEGRHLESPGCEEGLFVERTFFRHSVDDVIRKVKIGSYYLFITGLSQEELNQYGIDERIVQVIEFGDGLLEGKLIALPWREEDAGTIFERFIPEKHIALPGRKESDEIIQERHFHDVEEIMEVEQRYAVHWLHLSGGKFYWRQSKGNSCAIEENVIEESLGEMELIEDSHQHKDRVVLVSGEPGSGKTTVVSDLIRKIKSKWTDVLVLRLDFKEHVGSRQNPLSLANIEEDSESSVVMDFFFKVLRLQSPQEMSLVNSALNEPPKMKMFFDGLSEVVPGYKKKALRLMKTLLERTSMQLWVTTRSHERVYLEMELKVASYRMKPFTPEDQAIFLNRFWKRKLELIEDERSEFKFRQAIKKLKEKVVAITNELEYSLHRQNDSILVDGLKELKESIDKYEGEKVLKYARELGNLRSKTDNVDFTTFAKDLLDHVRSSTNDENKTFTELPLHLYMLAELTNDNNFKMTTHCNIFHLYSNFAEKKIQIYLTEKNKIEREKPKSDYLKAHRDISSRIFQPVNHQRFSLVGERSLEDVYGIGLVEKIEDHYQFKHLNFGEYFVAENVLEKLRSEELEAESLVEVLLADDRETARRFLDCFFRMEGSDNIIKNTFIQNFNVKQVFIKYIRLAEHRDFSGTYILRKVLQSMERFCDSDSIDKFVLEISTFLERKAWRLTMPMNAFRIISFCLTEAMLFKLFDEHIHNSYTFVFSLIGQSPSKEVSHVVEVFQKLLRFNDSQPNFEEEEEKLFKKANLVKKLGLFDVRDNNENNVFHIATWNTDGNVFVDLLRFAKGFLGDEEIKFLLLERNAFKRSVIHECQWNGSRNFAKLLDQVEPILDARLIIELMKERYGFQRPNSCIVTIFNKCRLSYFDLLLEYLRDISNVKLLKEMLLSVNGWEGNIILHAAQECDLDTFTEILKKARVHLNEDELKYHVGISMIGRTVFSSWAMSGKPLNELSIIEPCIGKERMEELLLEAGFKKRTCLHYMIHSVESDRCVDRVIRDLSFLAETLNSKSLKKLLLATDNAGNTFLHWAAEKEVLCRQFNDVYFKVRDMLNESSFQKLISTRNIKGEKVGIVEVGDSIQLRCVRNTPNDSSCNLF